MADIFDSYTTADAWDEMFERPGVVRRPYAAMIAALQPLDVGDLRFRTDQMARAFTDRGVTYSYGGEERPFPLDLVPRLLDAVEWDELARGVRQRVRALEAFLSDVYGRQQVLSDGVVPHRLLYSSPHFHRAAHGFEPPNGVRIHVSGIDLVRDEEGRFRVLEDNVRVPSGVSYVIENRRVMTRTFPALFTEQAVQPVDEYPQRLLAALKASAPEGVTDPTVVVLTPGVANAAYFEHALLARLMGVQLVEGRDLVCSGNRVRMRTTRGESPVHVVYKRLDDDFLDPVHFRPDSLIGVPGIVAAARAGNVTLANAVGNGIADDKLLYTYVPDLIRYYLAEEPLLPNVETIRPEEPGRLEEVLDRLDRLVLKPVDGAGGKGIVIGPSAEPAVLERLAKQVAADPRGWIAQRPVALSTSPTLSRRADGSDALAPRHIDLRPFAVNDGDDVWLLPGGLTRVALGEGNLIVNSSQGGGSKDTWVLPGPRVPHGGDAETFPQSPDGASRSARSTAPGTSATSTTVGVSPRQFGPGAASAAGGRSQEEAQQQ